MKKLTSTLILSLFLLTMSACKRVSLEDNATYSLRAQKMVNQLLRGMIQRDETIICLQIRN